MSTHAKKGGKSVVRRSQRHATVNEAIKNPYDNEQSFMTMIANAWLLLLLSGRDPSSLNVFYFFLLNVCTHERFVCVCCISRLILFYSAKKEREKKAMESRLPTTKGGQKSAHLFSSILSRLQNKFTEKNKSARTSDSYPSMKRCNKGEEGQITPGENRSSNGKKCLVAKSF